MRIRFQADADFNHNIVAAVLRRAPDIDIRTAAAAALAGLKDASVLALAALDGRVLLTHDNRTMPRHFADFIQETAGAGVIVVPQSLAPRDVVDDIVLIWTASTPEEWTRRILYLPL